MREILSDFGHAGQEKKWEPSEASEQEGADQEGRDVKPVEVRKRLDAWSAMPVYLEGSVDQRLRERVTLDESHEAYREPIVNIKERGLEGNNFYFNSYPGYRKIFGLSPDVYLRASVVESLAKINQQLEKVGLYVYVTDGWRKQSTQMYARLWHLDQKIDSLPSGTTVDEKKKLLNESLKQFSNADYTAPHLSGGAFDLEIRVKDTGKRIPCRPFENFGDTPGKLMSEEEAANQFGRNSYVFKLFMDLKTPAGYGTGFKKIEGELEKLHGMTAEQRQGLGVDDKMLDRIEQLAQNRRMIYRLLTTNKEQGGFLENDEVFTMNPSEYWHYGRGDRSTAVFTNSDAFYGFVHKKPPEGDEVMSETEEEEAAESPDFDQDSESLYDFGSLKNQFKLLKKTFDFIRECFDAGDPKKDYLPVILDIKKETLKVSRSLEQRKADVTVDIGIMSLAKEVSALVEAIERLQAGNERLVRAAAA